MLGRITRHFLPRVELPRKPISPMLRAHFSSFQHPNLTFQLKAAIERSRGTSTFAPDRIKSLIDKKADLNSIKIKEYIRRQDSDEVTPLYFLISGWRTYLEKVSIFKEYKDVLLTMIEKVDDNHLNFQHPAAKYTALHHATMIWNEGADNDFLKKLINKGANPHLKGCDDRMPLDLLELGEKNKETRQLLIEAMANFPLPPENDELKSQDSSKASEKENHQDGISHKFRSAL